MLASIPFYFLGILIFIPYVNTMCNLAQDQIGCSGSFCYHLIKASTLSTSVVALCQDCQFSSPKIPNQQSMNTITAGLQGKGLSGFAWIGATKTTTSLCSFVKGNYGSVSCTELDDRVGRFLPGSKILLSQLDDRQLSGLTLCRRDGCTIDNLGSCLTLLGATTSWYIARSNCANAGSELMYLLRGEENEFFKLYTAVIGLGSFNTNNKYWTGFKRDTWKWNDATDVTYSNWKLNEPGSTTAIAMGLPNGLWEAHSPSDRHFVLCMSGNTNQTPAPTLAPIPGPTPAPTLAPIPPGVTPAPAVPTLPGPKAYEPVDVSRVREFRDSTIDAPWNEQRSVCSQQNLRPAIVRYPTDQEILKAITKGADFWLSGRIGSTEECAFTVADTNSNVNVSCDIIQRMGNDFTERLFNQSMNGKLQALPLCRTSQCTRFNFNCLTYGDITSSWYEARNQCLKQGGDLFYLDTADIADLERVKGSLISIGSNFLNKQFWVGLRNHVWYWQEENGQFSEMKYTNWEGGEPTVDNMRYPCVSVNIQTGKWRTESCQKFSSVLCALLQSYTGTASSIQHRYVLPVFVAVVHLIYTFRRSL